jgi:hypothetical protein
MSEPFFETKAFKSSKLTAVLVSIFIVGLVLGIISFASGKDAIGPWPVYAVALVILYTVLYFVGRRQDVVLRIGKNSKGELMVTLNGPIVKRKLAIDTYSYWRYPKFYGVRTGTIVLLHLLLKAKDGEVLRLISSRTVNSQPLQWPLREQEFPSGEEQFEVNALDKVVLELDKLANPN